MDLNGQFGTITVLRKSKSTISKSGYKVQFYIIKCICGKEKEVRSHGKTFKVKSCGCLRSSKSSDHCNNINERKRKLLVENTLDLNIYIKNNIRRMLTTGCWNWIGTTFKGSGYGRLPKSLVPGDKGRAHRLSYIVYKGQFPINNVICHTCDNPRCVNPNHLFSGTNQENLTDMVNKGRSYRGEKHYKTKLHISDVHNIRSRIGESPTKLGKEFGISDCSIRDIQKRRSWKHV